MRIEGKVEPAYKLIPHATVEKKGVAEGGWEEEIQWMEMQKVLAKTFAGRKLQNGKGHERQERRVEQEWKETHGK